MNFAPLTSGCQPSRAPDNDTKAKEVRMSRLSSSNSANRELLARRRSIWLHFALGVQATAITICATVGCNSVGGPHLLNNTLRPQQAVSPSAPVSMSLKDESQSKAAVPARREIAHVSYQEPVTRPESAVQVASLVNPNATQASYQVSGCSTGACSTCGPQCSGSESACEPNGWQDIVNVQEYIFDGGDLDPALVVRKDSTVAGLNPTDTVAYYETYDGKLCITPTNRVPIYAPRFGAIRQVTGIILSEHALATERILAPVSASRFEDKNLASSMVQPIAPRGEEKVSLIDAFRDRNGGVPLAQVIPPQRMSDAIVPFEAIDFFRTGILKHEDIPVLGQFLQNAKVWETPESLEVLVDGQEAAIALDVKQAQDVHVYELPPGKCSLRICKAASHMIANSGDQISFTIRFDNIGTQPIEKVVILDSLSPRLEYIQQSQQSSLAPAPEFTAEPNDVGSTVLKWEFKSALKPGEGGVLHFRTLVR
jgi:uncharacterized repeat protein (TIGR01451 family)